MTTLAGIVADYKEDKFLFARLPQRAITLLDDICRASTSMQKEIFNEVKLNPAFVNWYEDDMLIFSVYQLLNYHPDENAPDNVIFPRIKKVTFPADTVIEEPGRKYSKYAKETFRRRSNRKHTPYFKKVQRDFHREWKKYN